ncbi:hypothetical protein Scep_010631 [Stephania cephalantha]|uniref:Uncharacterized protein n=1 Tax=Stephania cephalantha TaxID=152367 RepID=A0AAP0PH84_9MAGN
MDPLLSRFEPRILAFSDALDIASRLSKSCVTSPRTAVRGSPLCSTYFLLGLVDPSSTMWPCKLS